jgi:hypothetical protein
MTNAFFWMVRDKGNSIKDLCVHDRKTRKVAEVVGCCDSKRRRVVLNAEGLSEGVDGSEKKQECLQSVSHTSACFVSLSARTGVNNSFFGGFEDTFYGCVQGSKRSTDYYVLSYISARFPPSSPVCHLA